MESVSERIAKALGQARLVGKCLRVQITPFLEARQRTFAGAIERRVTSRRVVDEPFLRDLEAFIILVSDEVDKETSFAWQGHEHDPDCGYHVPVRTERGCALQVGLEELTNLASLVEGALDAAEACVIANALFDT